MAENSILIGPTVPFEESRIEDVFNNLMQSINKEKIATIEEGLTLSYSELDLKSDLLTEYLSNHLYKNHAAEIIIGIFMDISANSIISMISVFKLGAAYLPLDPNYPKRRIQAILQKVNVDCIITKTCYLHQLLGSTVTHSLTFDIESIFENLKLGSGTKSEKNELRPVRYRQKLACIFFTSGSTGEPKGVCLSHSNILNRINWQWKQFPFDLDEKVSAMKSLTFVDSLTEIFPAVLKGVPIVIATDSIKSNPQLILQYFASHHITRTIVVPTLLKMILMYLDINPELAQELQIKLWISSGEALSKNTLVKFFHYFPATRIANFYGSTEVTGDVTSYLIDKKKSEAIGDTVPIGKPIDNTTVYITDENLKIVQENKHGEICVSGLNLAMGYHQEKSDKFILNPFKHSSIHHSILYRTGDVGYVKDGMVYFVGRADSQVKLRGIRIELNEIENVLAALPIIRQSAVCCVKNKESLKILAFCVPFEEKQANEEITATLKTLLPSVMVPEIVFLSELPMLINGKIDKLALVEEYKRNFNQSITKSNNEVHLIVRDVLGVNIDETNLHKTFYELGGASLSAVELLARLKMAGYYVYNPFLLNIYTIKEMGNLKKTTTPLLEMKDIAKCFKLEKLTPNVEFTVVAGIIAESFVKKNWIDIVSKVRMEDHIMAMGQMWKQLTKEQYSFVVKNFQDEIIGVMINVNFFNEPKIEIPERLLPVVLMHELLEEPCRKQLKSTGKRWIHNILLGTSSKLTSAENVDIVIYMEKQLLTYAQDYGFHGIFTINSCRMTQIICQQMLGYEVVDQLKVQNYIYNGKRIFSKVPSDINLVACYKYLN